MITLSYSTINGCLQPNNSHNWLNKIYKVPFPTNEYMKNGQRLHNYMQQHFNGKSPVKELEKIPFDFPIVEERAFDPRCRVWHKFDDEYAFTGYTDGRNPLKGRILEIKISTIPWSLTKFINNPQKSCYAFCLPEYEHYLGVTAVHDETTWAKNAPKYYEIPLTKSDRESGEEYIRKAIELLKKGDFSGGLDPDGVCRDKGCSYGYNCSFKE